MVQTLIALSFLLMILAPCIIALRVRTREEQADAQPEALPEALPGALPHVHFVSPLATSAELDLEPLALAAAHPEQLPGDFTPLTTLEEALAAAAEQVKLAQAVADRANLALRDALAHAAALRAEAAALTSREANQAAQQAARLAQTANTVYQQMLQTETEAHQLEARQNTPKAA